MSEKQIAHVRKFEDGSWAAPHFLTDPLKNTATLAAVFSAKFNAESWGRACGYSHDVGKGRQQWQKFLSGKSGYSYDEEAHLDGKAGKMPHAIHGAALAEKLYGKGVGRLLAYCIAGHQTGLPDWSNAMGTGRSTFKLLGLTEDLQQRGVEFVSLKDHIDTSSAIGKAMFRMLAGPGWMEKPWRRS